MHHPAKGKSKTFPKLKRTNFFNNYFSKIHTAE